MERTKGVGTKPIQWKKSGGGSFVAQINGKAVIIKPGQTFYAKAEEIPTSFRDMVTPVDPTQLGVVQAEEKAEIEEINAPKYELQHRGGGWWNVVSEDGKLFNEKALKREDAQELLDSLA